MPLSTWNQLVLLYISISILGIINSLDNKILVNIVCLNIKLYPMIEDI